MNNRRSHPSRPEFDKLDERVLLSSSPYLTPAQLRNVYGLNSVPEFNIGQSRGWRPRKKSRRSREPQDCGFSPAGAVES
jgi:hypothetical protein